MHQETFFTLLYNASIKAICSSEVTMHQKIFSCYFVVHQKMFPHHFWCHNKHHFKMHQKYLLMPLCNPQCVKASSQVTLQYINKTLEYIHDPFEFTMQCTKEPFHVTLQCTKKPFHVTLQCTKKPFCVTLQHIKTFFT